MSFGLMKPTNTADFLESKLISFQRAFYLLLFYLLGNGTWTKTCERPTENSMRQSNNSPYSRRRCTEPEMCKERDAAVCCHFINCVRTCVRQRSSVKSKGASWESIPSQSFSQRTSEIEVRRGGTFLFFLSAKTRCITTSRLQRNLSTHGILGHFL